MAETKIEWTAARVPYDRALAARATSLKVGFGLEAGHQRILSSERGGVSLARNAVPDTEFPALVFPGYTFNPWRGCVEKDGDPACDRCYARELAKRNPKTLGVWGVDGHRALASEAYWKLPYGWDKLAGELGVTLSVFCLSLGDVWERNPKLIAPRARLLKTIHDTPNLRWLLLTKRPEDWRTCLAEVLAEKMDGPAWSPWDWVDGWLGENKAPSNVHIGVTAGTQAHLEERFPLLLQIPAAGYFVSAEPLLTPLDFAPVWPNWRAGFQDTGIRKEIPLRVIAGGESGPGARPAQADWFRALRDQRTAYGFKFFFKQWGEHDAAGERVGKAKAGRQLDGREWNEDLGNAERGAASAEGVEP
jgi:protein gp37